LPCENRRWSLGYLVDGDERRLLQVLWNLLTNAIKFTPENGLVKIEARKIGDYAVIDVIDNGIGIRRATRSFLG
jgi:signal transduction histidine kinase